MIHQTEKRMKQSDIIKEQKWLNLVKEALKEGVKVQANYRFKYKNKNLGSFLTYAKRQNKKELISKLKKIGVDLTINRKGGLEQYTKKFIKDLSDDKKPNKTIYRTKFTNKIKPGKNELTAETIKKVDEIWLSKFKEIRNWDNRETTEEKIIRWKNFRYDTAINPNNNWYATKKEIGSLSAWIRNRKTGKADFIPIENYFNKTEISELIQQGFKINTSDKK